MLSKIFTKSEAEHVLKMFLKYPKNRASCSYKLGSYKKKECMEPMQLPMNLNIVPSKIYCGVRGHSGGCTIVRKDTGILCVKLRLDEKIHKFSSYYISI